MTKSKTEKILDNFPEFMDKHPDSNNYKYINTFDSEFEDVSLQINNMKKAVQVSTAVGSELDDIGAFFLLGRNGTEADDDYRARILSYWQGFLGGGVDQSIRGSLANALDIDEDDIIITELKPLKFRIRIDFDSSDANIIDSTNETIQKTKAAGMIAQLNAGITGNTDGLVFTDAIGTPTLNTDFWIEESLIDGDDLIG